MFVTAHGGALGTGRNTVKYFDNIPAYKCDILEVDIRCRGGRLHLSHMPALRPSKCLPLSYAFEAVRRYGLMINCDMKNRGRLEDVLALAREMGVEDKILFTGNVITEEEVKTLSGGKVFFNKLKNLPFREGNAAAIRQRLDSYKSDKFAGINVNKSKVSDKFLQECADNNVAVSLFTVNTASEAKKYASFRLYNITANCPDAVAQALKEKGERS